MNRNLALQLSTHFPKALGLVCLLAGCAPMEKLEKKAQTIVEYEKKALNLARENRQLKRELTELKYNFDKTKSHNHYLTLKLQNYGPDTNVSMMKKRSIASVTDPELTVPKTDLVKMSVYKWPMDQVLKIGQMEFEKKNYDKAAQFLLTFVQGNTSSDKVTDLVLFQLGVASYESGLYYDWSVKYMDELIKKYPDSTYYRGAKLWRALSLEKMGKKEEFFKTVEEFRLRYRNTTEWKILSGHYEEIRKKYKM